MPKYSFVRQNKRIEQPECEELLRGQSKEMKAIISLLYLTGARISEVLALTPSSFVLSKSTSEVKITILILKRRKGRRKGTEPYRHTRTLTFSRSAPFMNHVMNYVRESRLILHPEGRLFSISRQLVGYYIWKVSKIIAPHSFRHSRLQKLADKGATARQIQAFAGHASITSSDAYVEASEALIAPTKDLID